MKNSYITHLNHLQENHNKGVLKVKKLPSQVQPKRTTQNQEMEDFNEANQFNFRNSIGSITGGGSSNDYLAEAKQFAGHQSQMLQNKFSNLYAQVSGSEEKKKKKNPLQKAGEFFMRKISSENDDEIFSDSDCADTNDRFYLQQINDTKGKGDIDEKLVAEVTGAKEVLKKASRHSNRQQIGIDGDMNIFEILQLFRARESGSQNDPIQQMLMAYAQADNEVASDEIDDHEHDHFENDFASMLLGHHEEVDSENGEEAKFAEESDSNRLAQA